MHTPSESQNILPQKKDGEDLIWSSSCEKDLEILAN